MRRVKTKEEMEKEFGKNWINAVRIPWDDDREMFFLLGRTLTQAQCRDIEANGCIDIYDDDGFAWTLSEDCTIEECSEGLDVLIKDLLKQYSYEEILDTLLIQARESCKEE